MTKNKSKPLALLLAGLLWSGIAHAQESANSSGGNATSSSGSVSYSVGQVAYTSLTTSSGTVAQGVQHTYEISTLGTKDTTLNVSLKVFPNPTQENLTLQISEYNKEKLQYQLFDMQGKLLSTAKIISQFTIINTSSFPSATYIIHVVNLENKNIQSFKIIKK